MNTEAPTDHFVVTSITPVKVADQEFANGAKIPGNLLRTEWEPRQLEMVIRAGLICHEAEVISRINPAWVTDPRFPTAHAPDSSHSMTKWVSAIGQELAEPFTPAQPPSIDSSGDPAPHATPLTPTPRPADAKPLPVAVPALLDETEDFGDGPGTDMVEVVLPPLPGEDLSTLTPPESTSEEVFQRHLADTLASLPEVKAKAYVAENPDIPAAELIAAEQAGRNRQRFITWLEAR